MIKQNINPQGYNYGDEPQNVNPFWGSVSPDVNIEKITVQPKTTQQLINAPLGVDGYNPITVEAVTASIDPDIKPDNIKKGVEILGVEGTLEAATPVLEPLTVTPSTSEQVKTPTGDGFNKVTVKAVTAAIDSDIIPENIKKGVNILGVTGSFDHPDPNLVTLNIKPKDTAQTFRPSTSEDGYNLVNVEAVTAAIDADIKAENIKKGINILGVVGSLECKVPALEALTVTPTTSQQVKTPTGDGFNKVTVEAVTAAIDADIKAENIKKGVDILGVVGSLECKAPTLEPLTVTPSTSEQVKTPTGDGFNKVTVEPVTAAIDADIIPENILEGVDILGVVGTLKKSTLAKKTTLIAVGFNCWTTAVNRKDRPTFDTATVPSENYTAGKSAPSGGVTLKIGTTINFTESFGSYEIEITQAYYNTFKTKKNSVLKMLGESHDVLLVTLRDFGDSCIVCNI